MLTETQPSLLPKVTVVGLRSGQGRHLEEKCAGTVKLKFIEASRSETRFPGCDAVFLMTKFIEHRWTQSAYQTFPRERVHLHHGGISGLVKKIRSLVEKGQSVDGTGFGGVAWPKPLPGQRGTSPKIVGNN